MTAVPKELLLGFTRCTLMTARTFPREYTAASKSVFATRAKPKQAYLGSTPTKWLFPLRGSGERFVLVGEEVKAALETLNKAAFTVVSL
jgi:hypothetical protein